MDFNPRSPHRERPSLLSVMKPCCLFQSTLPSQGATYVKISVFATHLFQSTLPSQGATIALANTLSAPFDFNPRSPHRERLCILVLRRIALVFQSTLPSQGATAEGIKIRADLLISIHAPLTGSDRKLVRSWQILIFQSTLPSQGATDAIQQHRHHTGISIHAPLTGSDLCDRGNFPWLLISIHAPLTGSDRYQPL